MDNPFFAKFDAIAGTKTPAPGAPMQSRADEIRAMGKAPEQTTTSEPGLFDRMKSDIQSSGKKVQSAIAGDEGNEGKSSLERGFSAASEAASAIPKVASELLPKSVRESAGKVAEGASNVVNWLGEKIGDTQIAQDWVKDHPDAAKALESAANIGASAGNIAGTILATEGGARIAEGGVKAIGKMAPDMSAEASISPMAKAMSEGGKNAASDLKMIQDMISPKATVKEAKLAMDQGRIYKGKEPGIFTKGAPDKVAVSDQQLKSTMTINEHIPGAAKMDEPTLYTAIKEKIGNISDALKPEMEKVSIKPETVQKITDEWNSIKKSQIADAPASEEANVAKRQSKFESFLQKSKSGTMNDIWETRQIYDDSVPSNVKQATNLSSDSLQAQKSEWLQNREVLTNAMNDIENGLGETSRKAFSDMRNLYEAKNGILSKAKIDMKEAPSKIGKFLNETKTGKVIKNAVKYSPAGVGADVILKKSTGLGF